MTTAADTDTIDHLDFQTAIPCEAKTKRGTCDTPADILVVGGCPACGVHSPRKHGVCWPHWHAGARRLIDCVSCGHTDFLCGGFFKIAEVLS